jgi:phosphate transport system ATP-binding protein
MVSNRATVEQPQATEPPKMRTDGLSVFYGKQAAVKDVCLAIEGCTITSLIGASGSGKSTFVRALNRMHDLVDDAKVTGQVWLDGQDIYDPAVDPVVLRKRVGMVFQRPNPFPKSIVDNVLYAPRIHGERGRRNLRDVAEEMLRAAFLWDEVKDRLHRSALELSGGQQQRLCIARVLAARPDVILMDEPTSSLDPIATARIEQLILSLRERMTIVIVTHSLQQAARISDVTAFLHLGRLVEVGRTTQIFTKPNERMTEDYVTGRFG